MKTIGVSIPCYKGHISKIQSILDSIETQTVKPDNVIISCSSSYPKDIPSLPHYSFNYNIVTTSERHNTAQNRNKAAGLLNTDLITFMDVDDLMHPQRIEILKTIEDNIIIHSFSNTESFIFECDLPVKVSNITSLGNISFHAAHVTVTSDIFKKFQFNESSDFELNADTDFCERLMNAGYKIRFIQNILSKGNPSFTCFFEKDIDVYLPDIFGNLKKINPPKQQNKRMFSLISR